MQTFVSTEGGEDLPYTPAKTDSDPVVVRKDGTDSWIVIEVYEGALPLTEENVKKGYATEPAVSRTQVANVVAYKLTFSDTSYDFYVLEQTNGPLFKIQVPKNNERSQEMLRSFSFTK